MNDLTTNTLPGTNYFINPYIRMGVSIVGAGLELVDEKEGKEAIMELEWAKQGSCSK